MIILDTNVISELMRESPDERVRAWISRQKPTRLGLTAIAIAEIRRGLARLPKGKRRSRLEESFTAFVADAFGGRIFVFDEEAAHACGDIAARREAAGLHADAVDMMIAAIVKTQNAALATRNGKDFEGCGIEVVNPWG